MVEGNTPHLAGWWQCMQPRLGFTSKADAKAGWLVRSTCAALSEHQSDLWLQLVVWVSAAGGCHIMLHPCKSAAVNLDHNPCVWPHYFIFV